MSSVTLTIFVTFLLAALVIEYRWCLRRVSRPLEKLAKAANALLVQGTCLDVPGVERQDAVGVIAQAIDKLRQTLMEQANTVARLERLARHDHLTGTSNRLVFDESLARETEKKTTLSLVLVDIDRFKEINDTFGHAGGDAVLKRLAQIMTACAGPEATVSRIGGDEFAILLPKENAAAARAVALSVLDTVAAETEGVLANVRVSIGSATYPENCSDADRLRESADLALYHAKNSGRARLSVFGDHGVADMERRTSSRSLLMKELDAAIDSDQLRLHYQPKMCSRTNRIDSVEALIRWEHPVHGLLPPNDFIIAAEQSGRIERLSEWTLKQALSDQMRLAELGSNAAVYVNISGPLLSVPGFIHSILELTRGHEERIGLEITETGVIEDPENALKHLHMLVEAGLKIAIDDYGVGLSSLTYLKQLPAHELKIDRAFIADLSRTHRDPLLVRSTIDLAHALGMRVTAEGVEEAAALALLKVMGCDFVQGYLIAKPMPLPALMRFMLEERPQEFTFSLADQGSLAGAQ